MNFQELVDKLLFLEGDLTPKHVFFFHRPPEPKEPVYPPAKGPIIDSSGLIWRRQLNAVIQTPKFVEEYIKGTEQQQEYFRNVFNNWKLGKVPIKSESKHSLIGGGFIWDVHHDAPSIKVRFDIDGTSRTLRLRNIWWSYNEYITQYTA